MPELPEVETTLRGIAPHFEGQTLAHVQVRAPSTELPTVYLYDMVPGGVGLADKLFDIREQLLEACLALARSCGCENGCPSCVGPQVEPHSPAKRAATKLLERVSVT